MKELGVKRINIELILPSSQSHVRSFPHWEGLRGLGVKVRGKRGGKGIRDLG
jgi:hypothetical protein